MADLDRHRVTWTGFIGSPGLSTFYCNAGYALNAPLHYFLNSIAGVFPNDVNLQVEPAGDTIDSATGALIGTWADTAQSLITGTSGVDYSAVSGGLVQWGTNTFLSGRRLRGHTFLVPLGGSQYDASGQVINASVVNISAAAQAFVAATLGEFELWQRPRLAESAYTDRRGVVHPAITARGGGYGPVMTGKCRAVVTELRSRRD